MQHQIKKAPLEVTSEAKNNYLLDDNSSNTILDHRLFLKTSEAILTDFFWRPRR